MSTDISPKVRLIAVIGLVAAVLGGGGMMVLGGGSAETEEPLPPPFFEAIDKAEATAAKAAGRQEAVADSAAGTAATSKPEPAPKAAAAEKPAPEPAPAPAPKHVADNGLPMSIHVALQSHEVVVVSLFTPGARIDEIALEEARAGAKSAGAGFVALNVLDDNQGKAIAKLVGVQESPAVLVYASPDILRFQFGGFVDLVTVAQAATSARS